MALQVLGTLKGARAMGAHAHVAAAICSAPTLAWRRLGVPALHGACSWVVCSIGWRIRGVLEKGGMEGMGVEMGWCLSWSNQAEFGWGTQYISYVVR